MKFFIGLHHPNKAEQFQRACLSIRALLRRKKPIPCPEVLVDSAAFTELSLYGEYRFTVAAYAAELYRLYTNGIVKIVGAVAQDYMCEPFMLSKTGLTIDDHQRLTIERYDALLIELNKLFPNGIPFKVLPVLQGYSPRDYVRHIQMYGDRLKPEMWVGVGSICKRNGSPDKILAVLSRIHRFRPDLLLHGFGIKKTSLDYAPIRLLLSTADSMSWSFQARREKRNPNDVGEAHKFLASLNLERPARTEWWWADSPDMFEIATGVPLD